MSKASSSYGSVLCACAMAVAGWLAAPTDARAQACYGDVEICVADIEDPVSGETTVPPWANNGWEITDPDDLFKRAPNVSIGAEDGRRAAGRIDLVPGWPGAATPVADIWDTARAFGAQVNLLPYAARSADAEVYKTVQLPACEGPCCFFGCEPTPGFVVEVLPKATTARETTESENATQVRTTDPVNPATGDMIVRETDLAFPGFGVPFAHTRVYRSRTDYDGPVGFGWDHSNNRRLMPTKDEDCGEQILYSTGDGSVMSFHLDGRAEMDVDGGTIVRYAYRPPTGVRLELVGYFWASDSGSSTLRWWTMMAPDGTTGNFDGRGLLTRIEDPNFQGLTIGWEPSTREQDAGYRVGFVVDSAGRTIAYSYGDDGRLSSVVESDTGLGAHYEYDGQGDLVAATDSTGRIERYEYSAGFGSPDDADDYVAESFLAQTCKLACAPTGSECGAGGGCDDAPARGVPACKTSCEQAAVQCTNACRDTCGPAKPGGALCKTECEDLCDDADGFCSGVDFDAVCADMFEDEVSGYCGSCKNRIHSACNDQCSDAANCLTKFVYSTDLAASGCDFVCQQGRHATGCAAQFGLGDVLPTLWHGLLAGIGAGLDLLECGVAGICYVFGCDAGSCNLDTARDYLIEACDDACTQCLANGDLDRCRTPDAWACLQDGSDCESQCEDAFLGKPTDCNPGGYGGCDSRLAQLCPYQCEDQCEESCRDTCKDACNDGCGGQAYDCFDVCDDTPDETWYARCETSCVTGCIDAERERGPYVGPKYGHRRDLNHNLLRIIDGNGAVYVENTYGEDLWRPSFDAVIHQRFGDSETELHYRDMAGEASRAPDWTDPFDLPAYGGLGTRVWDADPVAVQHTVELVDYQGVDLCPGPCVAPGTPSADELYMPTPLGLAVIAPSTRLGPNGLAIPSGPEPGQRVPITMLRISSWTMYGPFFSSVTKGEDVDLPDSFEVSVHGATVLFTRMYEDGLYFAAGWGVDMNALDPLIIGSDRTGVFRAYPGELRAMHALGQGRCHQAFTASAGADGSVEITPADACDPHLVISPLATVDNSPATRELLRTDGTALADTDMFVPTLLVPQRHTVALHRLDDGGSGSAIDGFARTPAPSGDTPPPSSTEGTPDGIGDSVSAGFEAQLDAPAEEQPARTMTPTTTPGRYSMRAGANEGSAPAWLPRAVNALAVSAPLFRGPRAGALARPVVVFHVPADMRNRIDVQGIGAPRMPVPSAGAVDPTGSHSPAFEPAAGVIALDTPDGFALPPEPTCVNGVFDRPRSGTGPGFPKPATATVVIDPDGYVHTHYYDRNRSTLRSTDGSSGTSVNMAYDEERQLVGRQRPLGDRECLAYDTFGNVVSIAEFGTPTGIGGERARVHKFEYTQRPTRLAAVYEPTDPTRSLAVYHWDTKGNLTAAIDGNGEVTTVTPSDWGEPLSTTAPDGTMVTYAYDMASATVRQTTVAAAGAEPLVTTVDHDRAGRPVRAQYPAGASATWTWADNRVVRHELAGDGVAVATDYSYDAAGQVAQVASGPTTTTYDYALTGGLRRVSHSGTDGTESTTCFDVGPGNVVGEEILPDGTRRRFTRDSRGLVVRVEAGALVRDGGWDADCPSLSMYVGVGAHTAAQAIYDANRRPIEVTDGAGAPRYMYYDSLGRLAMTIDAAGVSTRAGYDDNDRVTWTSVYAASGASTAYGPPLLGDTGLVEGVLYAYDAGGRLIQRAALHFDSNGAPVGDGVSTTSYHYDSAANTVTVTNDLGESVVMHSDGLGRPTLTELPTGDFVHTEYTSAGRVATTTRSAPVPDGTIVTASHSNAFGAPTRNVLTFSGGSLELSSTTYDSLGRPVATASADGTSAAIAYDGLGRVASVARSAGGADETVHLTRDERGRVIVRTSEAGAGDSRASYFEYDSLGRPRYRMLPGGVIDVRTYQGATSRVATSTDGRGVTTSYEYSPTGQPATVTAGDLTRRYEFDGLGRLVHASQEGSASVTVGGFDVPVSASGPPVQTALGWDSLGNRTAESMPGIPLTEISHEYDGAGRRVRSSFAGYGVDRTYDAIGRLTGLAVDGDGDPTIQYEYAGLGGPTHVRRISGLDTAYSYDARGRRVAQTDAIGSATQATRRWEMPLADNTPRLDHAALGVTPTRTSVFEIGPGARVLAESHDIAGLGSETIAPLATPATATAAVEGFTPMGDWRRYTVDGRGNWLQRDADDDSLVASAVLNELDGYASLGAMAFAYDGRGSATRAGDLEIEYDDFGQPVRVSTPTATREYTYDALGRVVSARDPASGAYEEFAYDGLQRVVRTRTGDFDVTIYGDGLDELLLSIDGSGPRRYYHQDRLGSVYAVSDEDASWLESYSYTAYGERTIRDAFGTERPDSAVENRFGFQGHPHDPATGLVDMRARLYSPTIGRFLSVDPIGHAGGSNLYAFLDAAPMSGTDRLGLNKDEPYDGCLQCISNKPFALNKNYDWGNGIPRPLSGVSPQQDGSPERDLVREFLGGMKVKGKFFGWHTKVPPGEELRPRPVEIWSSAWDKAYWDELGIGELPFGIEGLKVETKVGVAGFAVRGMVLVRDFHPVDSRHGELHVRVAAGDAGLSALITPYGFKAGVHASFATVEGMGRVGPFILEGKAMYGWGYGMEAQVGRKTKAKVEFGPVGVGAGLDIGYLVDLLEEFGSEPIFADSGGFGAEDVNWDLVEGAVKWTLFGRF